MSRTLVQRADKKLYYEVDPTGTPVLTRMTGFTGLSKAHNPKEYNRQYVDETFEESDVVGFSPSIAYSFDEYNGDTVHEDIVALSEAESLGSDALRNLVLVDFTTAGVAEGSYVARKRQYAVVPDAEGDSTDAYTHSGNFKVKGTITVGEATTDDDWDTITFSESVSA